MLARVESIYDHLRVERVRRQNLHSITAGSSSIARYGVRLLRAPLCGRGTAGAGLLSATA